jgi:hypothetical protein
VRTPLEVSEPVKLDPFSSPYGGLGIGFHRYFDGTNLSLEITYRVIGFCGKIYPVIRLACAKEDEYLGQLKFRSYCYNAEQVDGFVASNYRTRVFDDYQKPVPSSWKVRHADGKKRKWPIDIARSYFEKFFKAYETIQDKFSEMFLARRSPIFIADPVNTEWDRKNNNAKLTKIVYNGCLRDWGFVRLFDPYQAFQEIEMYLSNMAEPSKIMPLVPDTLNAESHGFDKWSFRKESTKKRKAKKR